MRLFLIFDDINILCFLKAHNAHVLLQGQFSSDVQDYCLHLSAGVEVRTDYAVLYCVVLLYAVVLAVGKQR